MSSDPEITYLAVQELRHDLPQLVGDVDWPEVEQKLSELDERWAVADEGVSRLRLAAEYRTLLADYPAARERLHEMVRGPDIYRDSLLRLAELCDLDGDQAGSRELRAAASNKNKVRHIFEQGVGRESYSLKLSNMDFTFWNLAPVIAGIVTAVEVYLDPTEGALAIAAAILAAIGGAKILVEEIPVDTTTVYLGLVKAASSEKEAELQAIISKTNSERERVYMEPMSEVQVKRALFELYQLRSIEPVDGLTDTWRVIEQHGRI